MPTGQGYQFAETKTAKSRRSLVLTAPAIEALKRHKEIQQQWKEAVGPFWQDNDFVFCKPMGEQLDPGYDVLVQLKMLLKKAGLPDIRFHDLRHSTATLLLEQGTNPKIVQEILGHSQISMTMDLLDCLGKVKPLHSGHIANALRVWLGLRFFKGLPAVS